MMIARTMLSYAVIVGARAGVAKFNTTTAMVQSATVAAAPMLGLTAGTVQVLLNNALPTTTAWAGRGSGDKITVSYSGYTFKPFSGSLARLATKTFNAQSIQTIP